MLLIALGLCGPVFAKHPCSADSDCDPGMRCTVESNCVAVPLPTPTSPNHGICSTDAECDPGTFCGPDGICIEHVHATPRPTCGTSSDCPGGLVCVAAMCTEIATSTPTPTSPPLCVEDADCLPGTNCRAGICLPPRTCEEETASLDCRGIREVCLGGRCVCGGDCNGDGRVFGTELTAMLCVLGGACVPEFDCASADVFTDGTVDEQDLLLARVNLELGCPGEGTPSVFRRSAGSERSIEIGSASGIAGEAVEIGVSLAGGAEVTTAHTDVLFSTEFVDIRIVETAPGLFEPDCSLDPRLRGTFSPVVALPQVPPGSLGQRRLRLGVVDVDLPFPADSFDEGALFRCVFEIAPGVAPGSMIELVGDRSRTEIGNFVGERFVSSVVDGVIQIPLPTATPAPTLTATLVAPPTVAPTATATEKPPVSCVGDCDHNGVVTVAELVLAVRIGLGLEATERCTEADAGGDGRVSVDELMAAVGAAIRGCES